MKTILLIVEVKFGRGKIIKNLLDSSFKNQCELTVIVDVVEATSLLLATHFDLVIVDIEKSDEREKFTTNVKQAKSIQKIILFTEEDIESYDITHVIKLPVDPEELIFAVELFLGISRD